MKVKSIIKNLRLKSLNFNKGNTGRQSKKNNCERERDI
jgi:hypothetical protein